MAAAALGGAAARLTDVRVTDVAIARGDVRHRAGGGRILPAGFSSRAHLLRDRAQAEFGACRCCAVALTELAQLLEHGCAQTIVSRGAAGCRVARRAGTAGI